MIRENDNNAAGDPGARGGSAPGAAPGSAADRSPAAPASGGLRKLTRFAAYTPLVAAEQAKVSAGRIRSLSGELKSVRAEVSHRRAARGQRVMELRQQGLSSAEVFLHLADEWGWTERELQAQLGGVRRLKLWSLVLVIVALVGFIGALILAPGWMILFIGFAMLGMGSMAGARLLKFTLFEAQLEERSMLSWQELRGRPGWWQRLLTT